MKKLSRENLYFFLTLSLLTVMILILFYLTQSLLWVSFFSFGFLWNWSIGNHWVNTTVTTTRYKYSLLKMITIIHNFFLQIPILKNVVGIIPATFVVFILSFVFDVDLPWISTTLGSIALVLFQKEMTYLLKIFLAK